MGRTICLWLMAFLALGSAIPVPEPASQQELMDMILNAKPEDNDINSQPISSQPLISETEVEGQVPTTSDNNPEPQESTIPEGEEKEILPPSETKQEVSESDQVQEVPEKDPANVGTDIVQEELEPEPVPNVDQTQFNQEESSLVPEEENVQVQPEELTPLIEEEPMQLNPYEEQIFPLPEEQQVPFDEDVQIMPVPADQIFYVINEEGASPIPEKKQSFAVIEEEEIIPVYEEEVPVESYEEQPFPIRDETEFQPDSEDTMISSFGNDEETPVVEEPEGFLGTIMVDLDEPDLGQPISEEPIIPVIVYEEPQQDGVMTYPEEDESVFGSFVPPYFGEEPQPGEILVMHEESQGPVYFETFDDAESIPVEMLEVPEDIMEMPVEMPVEEMPFSAIGDINENPFTNSEVISYEVFPIQPSGIPYDDSRPLDDMIEDYYIPDENILEDDVTDDYPETPFLENEGEAYFNDDLVPDIQATQEETITFLDGPSSEVFTTSQEESSEESFIVNEFDPEYDQTSAEVEQDPTMDEYMTDVDTIDIVVNDPILDSGIIPDEDLPWQNGGDLIPVTDQQNFPGPAPLEETVFITEQQGFGEDGEEPIIEIIHLGDLPQNPKPLPFGVSLLTEFIKTESVNPEMPEGFREPAVQQMMDNEQIVPIAKFPEMDDIPVMIEEDSYLLPRNPIQEPIIFPEEMPPRHNLPVFTHQWSEENFFRSPNDGHIDVNNNPAPSFNHLPSEPSTLHEHPIESSYYSPPPPPFQGSSYGPPVTHAHSYGPPSDPSYYNPSPFQVPPFDPSFETAPSDDFHQHPFMVDQPQPIVDMLNDMSPQMSEFMPPSEVPDLDMYDDEDLDMDDPDDHFDFPSDVYQNSRFSNILKRFDNFNSFELPSLPEMTFQQDFQGPNTFPLNFRGSDFTPDFFNGNFNPYKQRMTGQNMNQENLPESFASPQPFQRDPSSPGSPNSMPFSPNTFLPMFSEATRNPSEESMNLNFQVFENPSMPMNLPNTNQRQQQYDVQVSFIPYETSFSFQPKNGPGNFDSRYSSGLQPNPFHTYQGFPPYSFPTYGEPAPYQQLGLYPPQIINDRYAMGYNYRDQFNPYHPYNNYRTTAW